MFNVFLTPHNLKGCAEKRRHLLESTSSLFYLSVGSANNAASLAISDTQEAMEQAGLYTRNAKHYTKRTPRFVDAYEAHLHRAATHDPEHQRWQFMLDYYDAAYDAIRPDLQSLRLLCANRLDYYKLPHADVGAAMAVAHIMLHTAQLMFRAFWDNIKQAYGLDFRTLYQWADFLPASRLYASVTDVFDPDHKVEFNSDPNIRLTFDTIVLKLSDPTHINKAGIEALDLNPDVREQAEKEE